MTSYNILLCLVLIHYAYVYVICGGMRRKKMIMMFLWLLNTGREIAKWMYNWWNYIKAMRVPTYIVRIRANLRIRSGCRWRRMLLVILQWRFWARWMKSGYEIYIRVWHAVANGKVPSDGGRSHGEVERALWRVVPGNRWTGSVYMPYAWERQHQMVIWRHWRRRWERSEKLVKERNAHGICGSDRYICEMRLEK